MDYLLNEPWLMGLLLALALAGVIELGRITTAHFKILEDKDRKEQLTAIRDGLFVLVSLLLGFTLALAVPRFTERRSLLIDESVSIGTTYLRAGTLPEPYREHSRKLLREYVDARLELDNANLSPEQFADVSRRAKHIQSELWSDVLVLSQTDRTAIAATYINTLNQTIDLHDKRIAAMENRIPISIWLLISSVALIAVFARGLTLNRRFWLTLVLAPITIAIVIALVADLDTPGSGMIRLDQRAMQRLKLDLSTDP